MEPKELTYNQISKLLTSDFGSILQKSFEKELKEKHEEINLLRAQLEEKKPEFREEEFQQLKKEVQEQKQKIAELEIEVKLKEREKQDISVALSDCFSSVTLLQQNIRSNLTEFDKFKSNLYASPLNLPPLVRQATGRSKKKRKTILDESMVRICEASNVGSEMVQQYKLENLVLHGKYIKKADLLEWTVRNFKAKFNAKNKTLIPEEDLKKHVVSFLGLLQITNHHGCQISDVLSRLQSCVAN
jgi:hypothetical protein